MKFADSMPYTLRLIGERYDGRIRIQMGAYLARCFWRDVHS
jgi:hypothetical protein